MRHRVHRPPGVVPFLCLQRPSAANSFHRSPLKMCRAEYLGAETIVGHKGYLNAGGCLHAVPAKVGRSHVRRFANPRISFLNAPIGSPCCSGTVPGPWSPSCCSSVQWARAGPAPVAPRCRSSHWKVRDADERAAAASARCPAFCLLAQAAPSPGRAAAPRTRRHSPPALCGLGRWQGGNVSLRCSLLEQRRRCPWAAAGPPQYPSCGLRYRDNLPHACCCAPCHRSNAGCPACLALPHLWLVACVLSSL